MSSNPSIADRFHQSLRAADLGKAPLPWSSSQLDSFSTHGSTRADPSPAVPSRYGAAFSLFERTDAFDLVLDGLTTRTLARRELGRVLRRTTIYLLVLLFVAAALLLFFRELIAPTLAWMRSDLELPPSPAALHSDTTNWAATLTWVYAGCFVAMALVAAAPAFATWCLGGRKYQTSRESATVLRIIDRLVAHQTPPETAVELALTLSDAGDAVRERVLRATRAVDETTASQGQLVRAAERFQSAAADRLSTLRVVLPMLLLVVVGGATTLLYCLALFWPIVALLKDLALPGIST